MTSGLSFPGKAVVNAGKYNSFPWESDEKTHGSRVDGDIYSALPFASFKRVTLEQMALQ